MEIIVYTFVDAAGDESGTYSTRNGMEAEEYARKCRLAVIENTFTFDDSTLVTEWDFTESGPQ